MRRELEDANGKVIVWDAVEIEGGAQLIMLRPFHRAQAVSEKAPVPKASRKRDRSRILNWVEYAEHEGMEAWKKRIPRNQSHYKNARGRVFQGYRPAHEAWLKGWDAAEAQYLLESGGRPRPPRRVKKAASA